MPQSAFFLPYQQPAQTKGGGDGSRQNNREEVLGRHKLAFDEHAIQRMIERKVTEEEVIETLNHPDITGLRADPGRSRVRKRFGSQVTIEDVVYEEEPTRIVVISVARSLKK